MNRNELKFRASKIAETGLSGSVLELLIIGLAEEYAMEQNLQQTPCTAPLPCEHRWQYDEEIEGAKYCKLCGAMT